jgi:uncharacterized membrane protein
MMTQQNVVVAIYKSHTEAEVAVKELQQSGFDMKKLSIVARDQPVDEHVIGYYNAVDRMKCWAKMGMFWGMLFGSAFSLVPGAGLLLVAGPLTGWIVGALGGAVLVGGLSAIGAGLYSLGIPPDSILQYRKELKTGTSVMIAHKSDSGPVSRLKQALTTDKFVMIAHGNAREAIHAREIISYTNPEALEEHQPSHNSFNSLEPRLVGA